MTTTGSPTVRRRRLAAELRAIRDRRGESLQTVVADLGSGLSTSKLSRYELGSGLKLKEVESLLDHYQVTRAVRENLLVLAQEASRKGWWENYSDVSSAELMEFIGLEAEASSVAVWHVDVVTGILQTERYAHALMAQYSKVEPIAPAIIERRVELRMRRKQVLDQDPPLNLQVVLDESVLKRQFGDESVMYSSCSRWPLLRRYRTSACAYSRCAHRIQYPLNRSLYSALARQAMPSCTMSWQPRA